MQQGWIGLRRAALLCAVLGLGGCTFSDALRHNEVWSVRPAPAGAPRKVLFATDRELDATAEFHVGRHWAAVTSCGFAMVTAYAQVSAALPEFRNCAADDGAPPSGPHPADMTQTRTAPLAPFAADVKAEADARHCNRMLLYVHGYNTVFRTALLHAGQISQDAHWGCAMALFSWSSEGQFDRYAADIERSAYSVPVLINLLRAVAEQGLEENILAHSMGARITLSAVAALEPYCKSRGRKIVGELMLAAPDINAEHDNDDTLHLLARAASCVRRVTIYASDNDTVLILSEGFHGGIPRTGRVPDKDLQYAACEALPADVVDTSLAPGDKLGHGNFINSYEIMDDIARTLAGETRAARATGAKPTLLRGPDVPTPCKDGAGQTRVLAAERYTVTVAPDRRPSWVTRFLRRALPIIIPVQ